MATIRLVKKGKGAFAKAAPKAAPVSFELQDNGDATFTVFGVDAGGNGGIDLSGLATMTATSSDLTKLTVDTPVKMTSAIHAVGPTGSVTVTIVVTFTSGTPAPLTIVQPVDLLSGGPTGLQIVFGTPTSH